VSGSGVRAQSADRLRPSSHRRSSSTVDKIGLHRNRLSRHSTSHGDNQTGLAILSKSGDPWQDWTTFDSSSTNDETRPLKRPLKSLTKKLMPGSAAAAAAANSTAPPLSCSPPQLSSKGSSAEFYNAASPPNTAT